MPGHRAFFANLEQIGYDGCVSVEAYTAWFADDARRALAVQKTLSGLNA